MTDIGIAYTSIYIKRTPFIALSKNVVSLH
jgi:hypothetical protein